MDLPASSAIARPHLAHQNSMTKSKHRKPINCFRIVILRIKELPLDYDHFSTLVKWSRGRVGLISSWSTNSSHQIGLWHFCIASLNDYGLIKFLFAPRIIESSKSFCSHATTVWSPALLWSACSLLTVIFWGFERKLISWNSRVRRTTHLNCMADQNVIKNWSPMICAKNFDIISSLPLKR